MPEISDNQLAAFLDGNLSARESAELLDAARCDSQLREFLHLSAEIDNDINYSQITKTLPMTAKVAANSGANKCAMLCELHILSKHGVNRNEEEWAQQAFRQGWLEKEGTDLYNIGRMLEQECFSTRRIFHASMEEVKKALERGCDVMAVVDSNEMTTDVQVLNRERLIDEYKGNNPNHAVIIQDYNPETHRLTIFDPAKGVYTFSETLFKEAWNDSCNYLVVVSPRDYQFYEPHPIDLTDVELPAGLEELREAIAENAHEVWAEARKAEGWKYGLERNDSLKETPDMVPYSDLPESEKKYDRDMAMQTLRLLTRLGYKIVKED